MFLTCVLAHMKYISQAAAFLIYIPACDFWSGLLKEHFIIWVKCARSELYEKIDNTAATPQYSLVRKIGAGAGRRLA